MFLHEAVTPAMVSTVYSVRLRVIPPRRCLYKQSSINRAVVAPANTATSTNLHGSIFVRVRSRVSAQLKKNARNSHTTRVVLNAGPSRKSQLNLSGPTNSDPKSKQTVRLL